MPRDDRLGLDLQVAPGWLVPPTHPQATCQVAPQSLVCVGRATELTLLFFAPDASKNHRKQDSIHTVQDSISVLLLLNVMAPPRPLYVITSHVLDDREDIEGLHAPEVYDSKDAANQAAKKLMRRITRRIDDDIDRDAWDYDEVVDDEGLYRG